MMRGKENLKYDIIGVVVELRRYERYSEKEERYLVHVLVLLLGGLQRLFLTT
jgi:hypothetical protein